MAGLNYKSNSPCRFFLLLLGMIRIAIGAGLGLLLGVIESLFFIKLGLFSGITVASVVLGTATGFLYEYLKTKTLQYYLSVLVLGLLLFLIVALTHFQDWNYLFWGAGNAIFLALAVNFSENFHH